MTSKVTNQQQVWNSQEVNIANTYKNIANMLPAIRQYMLSHVENVKNGNGIITTGDFQEAFSQLETMINDRLRSSCNSRVSITLSNLQTHNSNGGQNMQVESKLHNDKLRLTESQLHNIVRRCFNEYVSKNKVNESRSSRLRRAMNESCEGLDYWKVDFIDQYDEKNGFSLCVCCPCKDYVRDEILDVCIRKGLVDRYDVEDFVVNVEEISDDAHEMRFWKSQAVML